MRQTIRSYSLVALGSVIFALAFDWFFGPNQVAMGGVTGLAQVINAVFPPLSVGVLAFLLNVPLFLAGWKFIGFHLLASSPSPWRSAPRPSISLPPSIPSPPWTPCWPACAAAP